MDQDRHWFNFISVCPDHYECLTCSHTVVKIMDILWQLLFLEMGGTLKYTSGLQPSARNTCPYLPRTSHICSVLFSLPNKLHFCLCNSPMLRYFCYFLCTCGRNICFLKTSINTNISRNHLADFKCNRSSHLLPLNDSETCWDSLRSRICEDQWKLAWTLEVPPQLGISITV